MQIVVTIDLPPPPLKKKINRNRFLKFIQNQTIMSSPMGLHYTLETLSDKSPEPTVCHIGLSRAGLELRHLVYIP